MQINEATSVSSAPRPRRREATSAPERTKTPERTSPVESKRSRDGIRRTEKQTQMGIQTQYPWETNADTEASV